MKFMNDIELRHILPSDDRGLYRQTSARSLAFQPGFNRLLEALFCQSKFLHLGVSLSVVPQLFLLFKSHTLYDPMQHSNIPLH